jgi:hypothetical protein
MGPGAGPGVGGAPPPHPDEEMAAAHGEPPVRFDYSMAGPMNTNVPQFGGAGTRMQRHQGHPQPKPHAPARRQQRQPGDPEKIRMARQIDGLVRKLARADAEKIVDALEKEGVVFADRAKEVDFLAVLDDDSRNYHVNEVIKKNYRRKDPDPTQLGAQYPGAARYARADLADAAPDGEYVPQTPQEAVQYADLLASKRMSREDAVKFMRGRQNGQPRR